MAGVQFKNGNNAVPVTDKTSKLISPICEFRRALDDDIPEVMALVTSDYYSLFGKNTAEYKIKKCFYSVVGINADEKIVAVICIDYYPNIPTMLPSAWDSWIAKLYNLKTITAQNTLWIHLMACDPEYKYLFVKPILEKIYMKFPLLMNLIVVVPPDSPKISFLEENFTCILPVGCCNLRKVQTLYLGFRQHYVKEYKIRLAVEEDNDDLVPLIDSQCTRFKELYGNFYISELLLKYTEFDRHLIVGEINEKAVALLILNGACNYKCLFKCFQMETFGNIFKIHETNILNLINETSSSNSNISLANINTLAVDSAVFNQQYRRESSTPPDSMKSMAEVIGINDIEQVMDNYLKMSLSTEVMALFRHQSNTDYDKKVSISVRPQSILFTNDDFYSEDSEDKGSSNISCPDWEENVFVIELMTAEKEHEVGVLCDLVESSFQCFPTRDYCVFSVVTNHQHFPLFDYFVKVVPRYDSIFPQELYILHRNAIKPKLEVNPLRKKDFKDIKKLITYIRHSKDILEVITRVLFSPKPNLLAYTLCNYTKIVGIIIVREEYDIDYYLAHYQIHRFLDFEVHKYDRFGTIEYCIVSPIFQKYVSFFLRETHRLSDMTILLYTQENTTISKPERSKPLPLILLDVVPVLSRRLPEFELMYLSDIEMHAHFIQKEVLTTSLYLSTPKLCSLNRIDVNHRIVVVGASMVGLSFIEELFSKYDENNLVNFNNLTLIDSNGIYDVITLSKYAASMFVFRGKFSPSHLYSVGFKTHLNQIRGRMTAINRKDKYVIIDGGPLVPYDYLFLTCGLQYHHPYALGAQKFKTSTELPKNVYVLNEYKLAEIAVKKLIKTCSKTTIRTIIVYGSSLHAYCCVASLYELNLPNTTIIFVEAPNVPDSNEKLVMDVFNNLDIYNAVYNIIDKTPIKVYRDYTFLEWHLNAEDNFIVSAKFRSKKSIISLECDFMFCYCFKGVSHTTFTAVNTAGLVFDGKLVIEADCRTNDPNIFAAGSMTKYSRKYFADHFVHNYYNSNEIGERLGRQIRAMLLPGGLEENKGDSIYENLKKPECSHLVPRYKRPLIANCRLPGCINYFDMQAPGKPIPFSRYVKSTKAGYLMITGDISKKDVEYDPKYFLLQLSVNGSVARITCFTKGTIEVANLMYLYGMNEKMLNNVVNRYKNGLILDFFEFFREAYFCAIYVDTFTDLMNKCSQILQLLAVDEGKSIIEDLFARFQKTKWIKASEKMIKKVKRKYAKSPYHALIVEVTMKYFEQNYDSLPMYAHPIVTKMLLAESGDFTLFKER